MNRLLLHFCPYSDIAVGTHINLKANRVNRGAYENQPAVTGGILSAPAPERCRNGGRFIKLTVQTAGRHGNRAVIGTVKRKRASFNSDSVIIIGRCYSGIIVIACQSVKTLSSRDSGRSHNTGGIYAKTSSAVSGRFYKFKIICQNIDAAHFFESGFGNVHLIAVLGKRGHCFACRLNTVYVQYRLTVGVIHCAGGIMPYKPSLGKAVSTREYGSASDDAHTAAEHIVSYAKLQPHISVTGNLYNNLHSGRGILNLYHGGNRNTACAS